MKNSSQNFISIGLVSGIALATLSTAGAAEAAILVPPAGLNPGDRYRLVFVTSTQRDATSSDIEDYNNFVTAAAEAVPELAALGTTWKAIGSTETVDARDNTETNPLLDGVGVPIFRVDGVQVADNNADLWDGGIDAPIEVSEKGEIIPFGPGLGALFVWTGTSGSGGADVLVGSLGSDGFPSSGGGVFAQANTSWVQGARLNQPDQWRLYGITDVLTVASEPAAVPEPVGPLGYITLSGFLLGSAVRRARKS